WLVEQPRGWDESGRPGSIAYRDEELAPFRSGGPVFLYVGRYTAVKRLPLLISAHARAVARLGRPAPLVLVGGHPGEWEGEHPLAGSSLRGGGARNWGGLTPLGSTSRSPISQHLPRIANSGGNRPRSSSGSTRRGAVRRRGGAPTAGRCGHSGPPARRRRPRP